MTPERALQIASAALDTPETRDEEIAEQAREIARLHAENDAGIARLATHLGAGKNYTANYEFDKADTHTRLFCAASDWMDRAESAERERDALRLAVDSLVAEREALAQERDAALLPRFDEVPEDCPIGPQCLAVGNCLRRCSAARQADVRDAPTYVDGPVDPDGAIKSDGPDPSFGQGRMG